MSARGGGTEGRWGEDPRTSEALLLAGLSGGVSRMAVVAARESKDGDRRPAFGPRPGEFENEF